MALRGLIAIQLAALVALAGVTVWRFPVWALVDERAHYDYVQTVAEEGRLPDLRDELISPEAEAIDEGVYPGPPRTDPAGRGLAGRSRSGSCSCAARRHGRCCARRSRSGSG